MGVSYLAACCKISGSEHQVTWVLAHQQSPYDLVDGGSDELEGGVNEQLMLIQRIMGLDEINDILEKDR